MNDKDKSKALAAYVTKTAEKRNARLNGNLNTTITSVLAQRGWSRQQFSYHTGIAHSTLSEIMSRGTRTWNIGLLLRVAVAFEVKLSDLIIAAESADDDYAAAALLAVAGTEPQTKERLTLLIQSIAPAGTSDEMLNAFYSADMMGAVANSCVQRYLSGSLSDREMYTFLTEVSSSLEEGDNFWTKFSEVHSI